MGTRPDAPAGLDDVELMTPWRIYAGENSEYLSEAHPVLMAFTIRQARDRDMEVGFSFYPGWKCGGFSVPATQRRKVMSHGWRDVNGPSLYNNGLLEFKPLTQGNFGLNSHFVSEAPNESKSVAVVAARAVGPELDASSLVDLTHLVKGNKIDWRVPGGTERKASVLYRRKVAWPCDTFCLREAKGKAELVAQYQQCLSISSTTLMIAQGSTYRIRNKSHH